MAKANANLQQQPFFCEGSPAMLQLESMVDRVGVRNVLYALSHICDGKAMHIVETWQDNSLAKAWANDATILDNFAQRARWSDRSI